MLKNYITIAIRAFLRQRLYSFINVIGLSTGLMSALLIFLWVQDEVKKNKFHPESERIFQVVSNLKLTDGQVLTWPITPGPLAEDILENIPQVEKAVRTQETGSQLFQYGDKSFTEEGFYADPDFFAIFDFPLLKGVHQLNDISSISISETLAEKLFGTEDAIGKTIRLNQKTDYTVTGVFKNVTSESSIDFEYILPFEVYKKQRGDGFNYGNFDHPLYLKLKDPSDATEIAKAIDAHVAKLSEGQEGNSVQFYLQPFTDTYLYSQFENGIPVGGRIRYVKLFSAVAVFILLIACINFMNISTARAALRGKEVGVRKVIGAQRKSLILQFLSESILITTLSMFIAIGLVSLALPLFNTLVEKEIAVPLTQPEFIFAVIAIIVITGSLAGSYPAFFLSSGQPGTVLKGNATSMLSGTRLRKTLVVFQFSLTVILIASSLVVYYQIEFIRNKNLGYDRQSVLSFRLSGNLRSQFEAFRNDALAFPGIKNISKANESLVQVQNQNSSVDWPGKPDNSNQFFRTVVVDYNFLETMGIELKEGRYFSRDYADTASYIVTQRAVEVMGLTNPVGAKISQWGSPGTVVGVVNDFHSRSLHTAVDPVIFMLKPEWTSNAVVRFDASKTQETIAHLEKAVKKYNPDYPFSYSFLEDDFEKLYNTEKVTGALALGFTLMAIIISGLGLLGLAAYTTERRKKEICIRKTLGASVAGLIAMISKEFIVLTFVAALIGCPAAYYLMGEFLKGYEYRIDLTVDIFLITAISVILISVITVIFQVAKAAITNSAEALRNE